MGFMRRLKRGTVGFPAKVLFAITVLLLLIFLVLLLNGCNPINTQSSTTNMATSEEKQSSEEGQDQEGKTAVSNSRIQQFVEQFSDAHPDFELLDYVCGDNNNAPILLAAIAKNLKNNTSSTIFVMDANGVGQIVLASEYNAAYRKEEGLKLEGNVVLLSLDVQPDINEVHTTDTINEIHDFEIAVGMRTENGSVKTTYSSKETIRSN